MVARGAAEFAGLDVGTAQVLLRRGVEAMGSVGLPPRGFTPPGWVLGRRHRPAVITEGLAYYTNHIGVFNVVTERLDLIPAICHRPGSRLSALGGLMVAAIPRQIERGRPLRLGLHPADLDEPVLVRTTIATLERLASRAVTYQGYLKLSA
jgi:hypothetical protein